MTLAYQPSGAALELFKSREPEVLIVGPAGTGKTRVVLEYARLCCEKYPGIRVLFVRQTKNSLAESVLVTWEERVLGYGHPAISGDAQRNHRQFYEFPNGSHIVIGGMDKPEKTYSAEYDLVIFFEAHEGTLEAWDKLFRLNRNGVMPYQQMIADTNPSYVGHWLHEGAEEGRLETMVSVHKDNPLLWDRAAGDWTPFGADYMAKLKRISSKHIRERLLYGLWTSAEGAVIECYDPDVHIVKRANLPKLKFFAGAVDWGFSNAQVMGIGGVDALGNLYLVAEVYRSGTTTDWFADRLEELYKEHMPVQVYCDPEEPERIKRFNDRLSPYCSREVPRICVKANNARRTGIELLLDAFDRSVRDHAEAALAIAEDRDPVFEGKGIYIVDDALYGGVDAARKEAKKTTCTADELPRLRWAPFEEGRDALKKRDQIDPRCEDHGFDMLRYLAMGIWRKDLSAPDKPMPFPEGSLGHLFGHDRLLGTDYRDHRVKA